MARLSKHAQSFSDVLTGAASVPGRCLFLGVRVRACVCGVGGECVGVETLKCGVKC